MGITPFQKQQSIENWREWPHQAKEQLYEKLLERNQKIALGINGHSAYPQYQGDPIAFCDKVFGQKFTEDAQAVLRSVRDHTVTIAKSANATGKTHCAAYLALWWFLSFPKSQVYTCAAPPEDNLKLLLWGQIGSVLGKHEQLFRDFRLSSLHLERSSDSFLTGVTIPLAGTTQQREAKFSGKHAAHLLFIVDEGDAVPDEVYRGIESCMSGGHARLLVMFNPRHESGPVYIKERDRQANVIELSAFRHPNVQTGVDTIPGAVTRDATVRRINEWSRALAETEKPDHECFMVPQFLVGTVAKSFNDVEYPPLTAGFRRVTNPAFSYMVLGQYPSQADNQLISRAWVSAARSRWDLYASKHGEVPPEGTKAIMGQDVAELGPDDNVAAFRYGGWVSKFEKWRGVDTLVSGERAAALYKARNVSFCNVDATGVGAGVYPVMNRDGCKANRIMVASSPEFATEIGEFGCMRDQLYWSLREWLRTDPGAMLPPDERLVEELVVPTYSVQKGKLKIMEKQTMRDLLKRSPDTMEALMLTFWEHERKVFFFT
jgi:hypothetical protein